jgi:PAS domain S-box-containing protein
MRTVLPSLHTISAETIFHELFERADIGMALVELDTRRFLRVNPKLCEITGYPMEALLHMTVLDVTHPEDRAADTATFERYLRREVDRRVMEKRHIRKDGKVIWVRVTTSIVQLGPVRCSFGIIEDVSERKAAQDALEAAERRKDAFLAMLAHELRNPLASIRNCSELLRAVPYEDEHFDRVRDVIERQSCNLARLVDDLLDAARLTTGKVTMQATTARLADIIEETLETVRPEALAREHELSVSLPSDVWIYADKLRLVQALGNLLNNAVKFTPDKGRIGIACRVQDGNVLIAVSDNGPGIPPDDLPHIFKLFEQARPGLARSEGGLGIGLSITKQLIEMHGGEVSARSEPGKGSIFEIRLPCVDRRIQPGHVKPVLAHAGADLLIVEDNADAADTLAMLLEGHGYSVRIARDATSALRLVELSVPDVMLVDIGLPDMDGCELAAKLRSDERARPVFMIAISGYGQQSDIERSLAAGFDNHLVKPVDFVSLISLLSADRRQARGSSGAPDG